jgi:hypothetical protein
VLLDGFIAQTGERVDRTDLLSGNHRLAGINVQVVADLDGRIIDTGAPIGGARHDSVASTASGLAEHWAAHLADGGRACSRTKVTRGFGPSTPYCKPPGRSLSEVRKSCNRALNSLRAAVERVISHLVNWRILDLGYRGRLTEVPDMLRTVTNLEIYRVRALTSPPWRS